jgi:CheY-like chemotaxis protein
MNIDLPGIIVADDDDDDFFFFDKALKESGIPAILTRVINGIEVLALLEQLIQVPQMIFLDINMPLMDGLTTLKRIRANEAYQEVRIVIFSTTDDPATVQEAYQSGATVFLCKPDEYRDYINIFKALLTDTGDANIDPGRLLPLKFFQPYLPG